MAAPNAWVYIEILAPDFRFTFLILLTTAWLILATRKKWMFSPAWVLLLFVSLCFIPWLYTTGNGRYFIPMLLASGPLCIALIAELPVTKDFRTFLMCGAVALQALAVSQNNPWNAWNSWGFAFWGGAPYFEINLDNEARTMPATYVTISVISYGLVAPLFPKESRWLNISSQTGADIDNSQDSIRIQNFLSKARNLKLMVPSLPDQLNDKGQPDDAAIIGLNILLMPHKLELAVPTDCRLQQSPGLAAVVGTSKEEAPSRYAKTGFWLCTLSYDVKSRPPTVRDENSKFGPVFQKIEAICPRFFEPGQRGHLPLSGGGQMRHYQGSDMRLYVFGDGAVYYKYYRALNPVYIGSAADILVGKAVVNCADIRGRSGLPWNRDI